MKTIQTNVYTFDELNDAAKKKAREWYRENGIDYEWYEFVYSDAKAIAALMGVDITRIFFRGFWSQGDGACFESAFAYKKGCVKNVKAYAPGDEALHAIATDWQALQKANGYKLQGTTKHQGNYSHSGCTRITASNGVYEFDTDDSYVRDNKEAGAEAARILRRLMDWIYKRLKAEYDYITDDAQIDEAIISNEYTFTETGKRFG